MLFSAASANESLNTGPTRCATVRARSTTTMAGGASISPRPTVITWKLSRGPTGAVQADTAAAAENCARFRASSISVSLRLAGMRVGASHADRHCRGCQPKRWLIRLRLVILAGAGGGQSLGCKLDEFLD